MLSINKKGQSFDVFKLLIAAVIAIVILSVLMSIIGQLVTPTGKPIDVAGRLISSMRNHWYQPLASESVTFDLGGSINRDALSEKSPGIQPEQICLSTGAFQDSEIWEEGSEMSSVRYTGTTKTDVRVKGVCGRAQRLGAADYLYEDEKFEYDWFGSCDCLDIDEQECCLLAIVRK